ncbi:DUF3891 family protein [Cohnella cellulosilytica]|uniref:DUF3891 family protein n=1 Tax=Cohnella cellulosilytica TaxID=986710 RepID=A0ABW2F7S9_9BACL
MIVAERDGRYVLTTNDDHARMAGQLAGMLGGTALPEQDRREEFVYAVTEHDRAWIGLDEAPVWNDRASRPYSVSDYPMPIRLPHYLKGLEEVASISEYAGLLCSMHYTAIPPNAVQGAAGGIGPKTFAVIAAAKEREKQMLGRLDLDAEGIRLLEKHLRLLQALDRMSLWISTQQFDETSSGDNDPYRLMFGSTEEGFLHDGFRLRWSARQTVRVEPYPWIGPVTLSWKRKELSVRRTAELGLLHAWQESPYAETSIQVLPEGSGSA